ncbi:MAG: hypothetical protein ACT4PY_05735 [Armatimonadota bacterium]
MRLPPRHVLTGTATKSTLAILSGLALGLLAAGVCPAGSQASASAPTPAPAREYRTMTTCHPPVGGVVDQRQVENAVSGMANEHARSGWVLADTTAYEASTGLCVLLIFRRP